MGLIAAALLFTPVVADLSAAERIVNDGQLILQEVPEVPGALVDRLNQYQNVRSAQLIDWLAAGEGIYVRTRFGDTSQVHRVFGQGGARRQVTYFREPIGQVARRPGSNQLAITMDRGGGEFDQIYLFDPATASNRLLTDGASRNRLLAWSGDGSLLAYQSTRRDGRSNDLWIMDPLQPASARLLVQAESGSWWAPVEFSGDRRKLLVQQFLSVNDSRIHLLDLGDGSPRLLAGDALNPSANRALGFDRDDEGFYYITNESGRAAELAWRSTAPEPETRSITDSIPWDVSDFALSPDGRRGAFVTNEEGISRLHLLDTRTLRFSRVDNMPTGLIADLKFDPDNRRLAMSMNGSQNPSDVFVVTLGRSPRAARSLQRWTYSEVGGLDTKSFVRPELIRYPTFDQHGDQPRTVPAFVYRPAGPGPHPVIIHVHGGPEAQYRPAFNSSFQMWIAELGAAVIAPNIRGSAGYDAHYLALDDGYLREDAVRDIGALLDWIAAQPELDAQRIAIHGSSYGGYIVLASAVHFSDRLKAGVDMVGISNFVSFLENTEEYRRGLRRREYGDERDPEMRTFLQRISPLNSVERIGIPLLAAQGRNDPRVPASESQQIVQALRERGQPVWYMEALNEGHGYQRKENRDVYEQATLMFLQRYLLP
ncbi:MAG: alpha/beta fold hydrolase [Xanthomonadales bacterium]|nr:alpha/beta fold hydrolase [Xanthomonadales bacterium]